MPIAEGFRKERKGKRYPESYPDSRRSSQNFVFFRVPRCFDFITGFLFLGFTLHIVWRGLVRLDMALNGLAGFSSTWGHDLATWEMGRLLLLHVLTIVTPLSSCLFWAWTSSERVTCTRNWARTIYLPICIRYRRFLVVFLLLCLRIRGHNGHDGYDGDY